MAKLSKLLNKLYYDPKNPSSFGGINKLFSKVKEKYPKVAYDEVKEWLSSQDNYTLHRSVKRKFPRLKTIAFNIDDQWQADLMDMSWASKQNDGVKYILAAIDVLSRHAFAVGIKNKSGESIRDGFEQLIAKRKPKKLQTDQGKEFKNKVFQRFLMEKEITFFTSTNDDVKCALVERFNRTLRDKIYRYLDYTNSHRYIDNLQDFVSSYNHSVHRNLKMKPVDVNEETVPIAFVNLYGKIGKREKKTLKIGNTVRIAKKKRTFEKGSNPTFNEEIFKVSDVRNLPSGPVYKLEDYESEPITSLFYPEEVQKVNIHPNALWKIDKILKTRFNKIKQVKEYFVKWKNWPEKYNSWITEFENVK